ncbi:MAG: enoyl-CoA hydratase-related protein [candidate division WOR-3 bacterium]|nr:enoyl-CoA hydratase-related protein [candidate division WOR-3 bacterium]MCX7836337.1 enoyl-CoA hydratase-related protein [candidate division WOR-3 bacterium]MDW8113558.1 enoyl-CoA hydratase-related protein [candidate division WOR-3 bacterium]
MEFKNIILEYEEEIVILKINRPQVLNALNTETILELEKAIDLIKENEKIRVLIITGEGKAFVAGADISEMVNFSPFEAERFSCNGHRLLSKIENLDKVVIAAINGYALGGGCEIALACDIRLMAEDAKIGQPEVKLGIIPGFGGNIRLPKICGSGIAKELIFTGEMIDANEALRIGLVNKIYPREKLLEEAKNLAKKIITRGPLAIKLAKQAINQSLNMSIEQAKEWEIKLFALNFSSKEAKEGLKAFLEKREPNWKKEE